jgi:hypothetical protein
VDHREIDVALTYASEQESYVNGVNLALLQRGVRTFYAPFEQAKLWGEDLIPYLQRVYEEWATLCVMFISKAYVDKAWPSHERRSALAKQLVSQAVYILPVRFDDTLVPGLPTTLHYVLAKDYEPAALAELIDGKLQAAKT